MMGDHERPGETDAARPGRVAAGTDQPPTDETEGHAARVRPVAEGTDQPPQDSEGHAIRPKGATDSDEPPTDEDAEGNVYRQ